MSAQFVRYESPIEDDLGRRVGVFGLTNTLGRSGHLSAADHQFWRTSNEWYNQTLVYPPTGAYDKLAHPLAAAWFKATATQFLAPIDGYLAILRRHGVACIERRSDDPGRVIYEDQHQVVVVPHLSADIAPHDD
ncbi:hypothetical protein [Pseudonocardia sp. ICBG162]|uniref:hypothetical protein n=1 Tax=Pseudonocardia sp. ICBG162 TaxID=2846761 RepID=UPI001CF674E9|nr:hypothetical protein [Pseudonocardia sp. ICBG162]